MAAKISALNVLESVDQSTENILKLLEDPKRGFMG